MNNPEKRKINIIESIKKNKKVQYLLIIIFSVAIVFIFLTTSFGSENNLSKDNEVENYVSTLEAKLENTLSKVDGVGKVSVIISVESGMETVLANKSVVSDQGVSEEPIVINGKTVVLKEKYPKITGVLIVAEGADKISVISKVQQATMSLLEIEAGQIEILKMKV